MFGSALVGEPVSSPESHLNDSTRPRRDLIVVTMLRLRKE